MAQVFLSYDRGDSGKAEAVALALENAGHAVWWDRHIKGGRRFSEEIEQALSRADAVVVLWSAKSIESDWVRDEAATGRDKNRLVPTSLDGSAPPLGFRQFQTIDLSAMGKRRDEGALAVLLEAVDALADTDAASQRPRGAEQPRFSRRVLLAGLGASAAVAVGGLTFWVAVRDRSTVDPEVAALLDQAWQAWAQGTKEGNSQAIGLYRRATLMAPHSADVWGLLGCAYGDRGHAWVSSAEREAVWQRAKEAGGRALELNPKSAYGRAAIAYARPLRGNWALMETEFRQAQEDQPGNWLIVYSLALLLGDVGRFAEAARLFGSLKDTAPTATQYFFHVQALWAAAQLEEAERLLEEAVEIFGTHSGIWWQRFDMLLHGGRASAAIAHLEDHGSRPTNLDEEVVVQAAEVARASLNRNRAEIERVASRLLQQARYSSAYAERAIGFASFLGQTSVALAIADALFFSRGFIVPDAAAAPGEALQVSLDDRRTRVLFLPSTKALRETSGFVWLVSQLGLNRYWRETNSVPDHRRS